EDREERRRGDAPHRDGSNTLAAAAASDRPENAIPHHTNGSEDVVFPSNCRYVDTTSSANATTYSAIERVHPRRRFIGLRIMSLRGDMVGLEEGVMYMLLYTADVMASTRTQIYLTADQRQRLD